MHEAKKIREELDELQKRLETDAESTLISKYGESCIDGEYVYAC